VCKVTESSRDCKRPHSAQAHPCVLAWVHPAACLACALASTPCAPARRSQPRCRTTPTRCSPVPAGPGMRRSRQRPSPARSGGPGGRVVRGMASNNTVVPVTECPCAVCSDTPSCARCPTQSRPRHRTLLRPRRGTLRLPALLLLLLLPRPAPAPPLPALPLRAWRSPCRATRLFVV
jgi:hypothetical protein